MKIKIVSKNPLFGKAPFEYAPGYVFAQDPAWTDYDWLVVFDDIGADEPVMCPRERTILATWEPVSIKNYSTPFTRQFGHLLTNRPPQAEKHPHYHLGKGYFPWYNGRSYEENRTFAIPPKTKTVSAVCSAKAMKWTRHFRRIQLLKRIVAEIPGAVWYGHGVCEFKRKCDAMDDYRYHVVLENQIGSHYWTEKIADAYLCECLPFYAGAPDLAEDFPADSFIPIPIDDPEKAAEIIEKSVADGEYEKRRASVLEAKRLLFEKYNLHAQIIRLIETAEETDGRPRTRLFPRKALRWRSPSAALEDGWHHFLQYLKMV